MFSQIKVVPESPVDDTLNSLFDFSRTTDATLSYSKLLHGEEIILGLKRTARPGGAGSIYSMFFFNGKKAFLLIAFLSVGILLY